MNIKFVALVGLITMYSCSKEAEIAVTDLTGSQVQFPLRQGSQFSVSGSVLIQQKKDGLARITVELSGLTGSDLTFPVHLHKGGIDVADAVLMAQLNPVDVKTGKSTTDLKQLADETPITYADLIQYEGSIKIHLSETGDGRKIILAAGNIGNLYSGSTGGRSATIAVCKSER